MQTLVLEIKTSLPLSNCCWPCCCKHEIVVWIRSYFHYLDGGGAQCTNWLQAWLWNRNKIVPRLLTRRRMSHPSVALFLHHARSNTGIEQSIWTYKDWIGLGNERKDTLKWHLLFRMPYHLAQCYPCKNPRVNSSKSASAALSKPQNCGFLTVVTTNTVWWLDISFVDISFAASPAMCGNYDALNLNNCETILLPKKWQNKWRNGYKQNNAKTW